MVRHNEANDIAAQFADHGPQSLLLNRYDHHGLADIDAVAMGSSDSNATASAAQNGLRAFFRSAVSSTSLSLASDIPAFPAASILERVSRRIELDTEYMAARVRVQLALAQVFVGGTGAKEKLVGRKSKKHLRKELAKKFTK